MLEGFLIVLTLLIKKPSKFWNWNILMLVLWGTYIILTWTFSWKKNDKFPEMLEILQHCNEEYVPNNDDMSKRVIFFKSIYHYKYSWLESFE